MTGLPTAALLPVEGGRPDRIDRPDRVVDHAASVVLDRREARLVSDDEGEFARLYDEHGGHVAAFVLRRCHRDDAADIVSETFLVAWRRRRDIPSEPMTRAWLYGVARRVAANHRRGDRRRDRLTERIGGQIATALRTQPDPEAWRTEAGELAGALARLSAADRELLFLTAWEELTPAEIAHVLDLPARIVHKRLFRARRRLQSVLDEQPPADDRPSRKEAGTDVS